MLSALEAWQEEKQRCAASWSSLAIVGSSAPITTRSLGEDEVLAEHGSYEEIICVDYGSGDEEPEPPADPQQTEYLHRGLPPVSPREAALHERAEEIFDEVWAQSLAPLFRPCLAQAVDSALLDAQRRDDEGGGV